MRGSNRYISFCALALLLRATTTHAASTPVTHGTLELIAENQWIEPGHEVYLGLHFQLENGWHIYWVNPGDSGEPPRVDWQLPSGLTVGATEWPTPHRLESPSIVDFGYESVVTLIMPMHVDRSLAAGQPIRVGAAMKLLVCSHEMCIPGKAQLSLALPVKSQPPPLDPRTADLFVAARKSLPLATPKSWKLSVADTKDSFVITAKVGHQTRHAVFFPLSESQIANAAPQNFVPLPGGFRLTLRKSDQLLKPIQRLQGVLAFSADRAYLIDLPVGKSGAASNSSDIGSAQFGSVQLQ
jgi:thiol:disulfide interchange protein DsbD